MVTVVIVEGQPIGIDEVFWLQKLCTLTPSSRIGRPPRLGLVEQSVTARAVRSAVRRASARAVWLRVMVVKS